MLTTVAAGRVYDYSYCIGMYSQSGRGFWAPQDFVLVPNGRIYVLSRGVEQLGQRVSKITFDQEFQGQFGSVGAEDGRRNELFRSEFLILPTIDRKIRFDFWNASIISFGCPCISSTLL